MDKKNKYVKISEIMYSNISMMLNHLNYTFELKIHSSDFYNKHIGILNELNQKINKFKLYATKKRINKTFIDNLIKDIQDGIKKSLMKIGSSSYSELIKFFIIIDKDLTLDPFYDLIEKYFVPLSFSTIENSNNQKIIIKNLVEFSEGGSIYEKIEGVSIFYRQTCVNGFFKKDTLNICKSNEKMKLIKNEIEHLADIPDSFKEKYIDQLSLKEFIIMSPEEIAEMMKKDFKELNEYKNKALSVLIKEFTKGTIEKQRKIITLFLISELETQFTAHIIYDLITDQVFYGDTQQHLSDVIYNSLNWNTQKLFKVSNAKFEATKKIFKLLLSVISHMKQDLWHLMYLTLLKQKLWKK